MSENFEKIEKNLDKIKEFATGHYPEFEGLHGLPNIKRVLQNARRIHAHEGGSWPLVESIIWLHDIGRKDEEKKKKNHAILSAKYAGDFLK